MTSTSENWPFYDDDEIEAVTRVLKSGLVNQWGGEYVRAFQTEFAKYCDVAHVIAVANGTVALEIALKAFNIGPGDEVIVSPRSFVASVSCVSSVGGTPVFADIDPASQVITAETIKSKIGPRTRAIIPVHLAGWPCDMPAIMALAEKHNLVVIEDCAQALGTRINNQPVGSFGHAATFSFCTDKIISTGGEGGMAAFRDAKAANWANSYKDHGKNFDTVADQSGGHEFVYVHDMIGTNNRMTEMQAVIGLKQLEKLEGWIEIRNQNAGIWREALSQVSCLTLTRPPANMRHAYYRFYALIDKTALRPGVFRRDILEELNDNEIKAFSGSCPEIYKEKAFADLNVSPLPNCVAIADWNLAFFTHPRLDQEKLKSTAKQAADIISSYCKTQ